MKVDIEDVLFWMDAIRNSEDRYRTLESFWKGQVHSKLWLIEKLKHFVADNPNKIVIHGGWNGVLASLLFNSSIKVEHIISVDIDPTCKEIANTINKRYEMEGRFSAVTADMCEYTKEADVVINTSTEHIKKSNLRIWKENIPQGTLVAAQNNDFFSLEEHINCVNSVKELSDILQLNTFQEYVFTTPKYKRFMVIGHA